MNKWIKLSFALSAIVTRVLLFWYAPLWYDENFSLTITRLDPWHALLAILGDTHPPLYYLLIYPIGHYFSAPWLIRIPSVILSIAAVWVFWLIIKRMMIADIQPFALFLFIFNPALIYYAQEARMYSLFVFLILLAFYALLARRWLLFLAASILTLYTQNYGMFYVLSLGIVAIYHYPKEIKRLALLGGIIVISFIPWLFILLKQMEFIRGNYWIMPVTIGGALYNLYRAFFQTSANAVIDIPAQILFYTWLIYSIIRRFSKYGFDKNHKFDTSLIIGLLPLILATVISWIWQPLLLFRPLVASVPFLIILFCGPIFDIWGYRIKLEYFLKVKVIPILVAMIFVLPILVTRIISFYQFNDDQKASDGTGNISALIAARIVNGDAVYFIGDGAYIDMYGKFDNSFRSPDCAPTLGGLSQLTKTALGMKVKPLADIPGRVWVIWADSPLTPKCEEALYNPILAGNLIEYIRNDEYIKAGLWMVDNGN